MRTLIVSDIHLTHEFDESKFRFLTRLFSEYDAIILNGDIWDGFSTTFDRFVTSKWKDLFPLLKSKRAIYLYGNHDQKEYADSRVSLFSAEQMVCYTLTAGTTSYHVEHGNLLEPGVDLALPSRTILFYINFFAHLVEYIFVRMGSPQNLLLKQTNKVIKKKLRKRNRTGWFLCGHTHIAEMDMKNKFANSGFIQYGKATYLVVDSSGPILKKEWYK